MQLIIRHFRDLTADELLDLAKLRISVFVVEQRCPYQEMDEYAGATLPEGEDGTDAGLWEQRRYEVAREMFVRHRIPAEVAVCEADELMNALKLRNTMHP